MRRPLFSLIKFFWLMNTNWKFQFDVWNRISLTLDRKLWSKFEIRSFQFKSSQSYHQFQSVYDHCSFFDQFVSINYVIVLFLNGLCFVVQISYVSIVFDSTIFKMAEFNSNLICCVNFTICSRNVLTFMFTIYKSNVNSNIQIYYIVFVLRSHLGSCVVHMVGINLFWHNFSKFNNFNIIVHHSNYLNHKSDARSSQPSQPYINTTYLWASLHCMRT